MNRAVSRKPGGIETRIAMVVLALLVVVGGGVYLRQSQINPAVLALRPDAQPAEVADTPDAKAIIDANMAGMVPLSPPEHFTAETLYEKIDGRADLYLASGFARLTTQRFIPNGSTTGWVEVFVYDMATPENAFAVFSQQRREKRQPVADLANAYRTPNALFMTQDRYYLELIGADASESLQVAIQNLARQFVATHGGTAAAKIPGEGLFPETGLVAGSERLIAANAFGDEQLDHIYTADYRIDGKRVIAFVSRRESSQAAADLADSYRRTLLSYGAETVEGAAPVGDAAFLRMFDTFEVVFSRGKYLAGVHEAADSAMAAGLAKRLAKHLEPLSRPSE